MSHEIEKLDKVVSIKECWHKLETIVKAITFGNSGLNWGIDKRDMTTIDNDGNIIAVPDYQAIVCDDNNHVVSVQKSSYEPIQNERIWETIAKGLEGVNHTIEVTGSLRNRKRIFVSVSLDDHQDYVVNKDKFKNLITFVSSHDGSMLFSAYDTSIRVVCANTLNWSMQDKGSLNLKVRHTKNNEVYISNMEKTLQTLFEKREEFYLQYEKLASEAMSLDMAEKILAGMLGSGEEYSTRSKNQADEILNLFVNGKGNKGKTKADLLNGVTEYYTHEYGTNAVKRFDANESPTGTANRQKLYAWQALNDKAMTASLIKKGEAMLATL